MKKIGQLPKQIPIFFKLQNKNLKEINKFKKFGKFSENFRDFFFFHFFFLTNIDVITFST